MIETITADQLDLIAPLWRRLNALHQELDRVCGEPCRKTTWEQRRLELRGKALGRSLVQIVRAGGEIAGYCFSSIDGENRGEIDSLFVSPEYRGKGVGKQLVENGLNWLETSGNGDIQLWVHPGNVNAIAFYWRLGFATGSMMKRVTRKSLQGDHC